MNIKAVKPYIYSELNFKNAPFEAWSNLGYATIKGSYPRWLHWVLFRTDLFPTLWQGEARLVFVQPVSLYFDAGFSVLTHEIIPFIWDCWPCYYDKMERWLKRHNVKTAFFTSSQEMEEIKCRLPHINAIHCPEATNTLLYQKGKPLKERSIDILEFGRPNNKVFNSRDEQLNDLNAINTFNLEERPTDAELRQLMQDARITVCFPKSLTHPEEAEGVETLTQRYWEAMLSGTLLVGHCPKELQDIIGYNPVIELSSSDSHSDTIHNIIKNIEQYQELADKNAESALRFGDWQYRMQTVKQIIDNSYDS